MVCEVSSIHTLTAQKSQGSQKRERKTQLSELIAQRDQRDQRGQHLTHRLAHLELTLGRRLFELSVEPLIIDKLVQGYIITARDVTALRAQQKRAAQAERMDAIGEVTSSVAHDFKNLITSLQGALECAREGASEAQEEWFEIMDLSAEQASTLVRQLLDFARDQPELSRRVSAQLIIQQSTQLIKHALEKNIELKVELPEEELMIFVNQSALINALVNLAINASHAMPQGGTLTLQARPLCLAERELGELPQGEYLCLSVQDTGVGIPEEHLELIFEPFFTTKPEGKGTGLGLASTYQLARRSGGLITVESEVGVGTRFELYFPLYRSCDGLT